MNRFRFPWTIGVALTLVAVALGACSSPGSPPTSTAPPPSGTTGKSPTNGLVQTHSGGNVTIEVKWRGSPDGSGLAFQVTMDTHSADLDQYDLGKLALPPDDAGREYAPTAWVSAPGGHHREGTLKFPVPDSLALGSARSVQLIIRGVAGVAEHALVWQLA
ncbi:MAG: hypothetical protein HYY01_03145 [Chloroflexi bacterium]|nr:hypothetical protein [Chloroflexota bacterium]